MAYAAVLSLMRILQEIKDPDLGVGHEKLQIETLQDKVSSLHDFLEIYSVHNRKEVKNLEIRIRETAYKAENIIESYVSTFILSGRNMIEGYRTLCLDLDTVIKEMMKVKRILDLINVQQRNHLASSGPRLTFSETAIPHMVGLVEDTEKIKDWLTSSSSKREVISIVGMGGIGKTTFARNLFDDSLIVYHFQVRSWVTVSQEYRKHEILAGLLDSTTGTEDLAQRLYQSLKGKRYLIVMDDIWDTKVWDEVKRVFPDDHNGSRIVLTTRLKTVGNHAASTGHLHDMRFLSSSESWNLFREKVFGGECCPPCLERIGQEIVRNCRGLPLSIVVIGGLLSADKPVSYWETIATSLNSILATDGRQCLKIFSLSYNHLPAHLKHCFLYFAIFREDYDIRRSKLIKLWIAEGFIKPNESKSLEEIAEECLEDLSNRSLIMVHKLRCDGKVKTYRVHDLLRDFCKTKAQKENLCYVINRYTPSHPKGIGSVRRVSIQPYSRFKSSAYISNSDEPPLPTRSLLSYDRHAEIIISGSSFVLLRVLDLGSGKMLISFPMEVVRLVHLRYLSLRCLKATIVPPYISSIWFLQTIVIDTSDHGINLPLEVWTMRHLRHVRITPSFCLPNFAEVKNFVILANLQTLREIRNFRFTDEIIKRIPKLKKLGVMYTLSQFDLSNIACLNELESLHIKSFSKIYFPPNFLPATLKKLVLCRGFLPWKDLTMVGLLPNLEILKLRCYACEGRVWEPNEGEFRELKFLELYNLDLVQWKANDSHFPKLKSLKIYQCLKLKKIPIEIGNIQTLEMIELDRESPSAVASAELILDEQRSFGNDVLQVHIKVPSRRRKDHLEPSLHEKKKGRKTEILLIDEDEQFVVI